MTLTLVTAPSVEPLTLAEAKAHLRVFVDDENTLIESLIVAARVHVENFTHRALISQVWDLKLDGFSCDEIYLPMAPLLTATPPVVTYTDQNGDSQTWSSSYYTVDAPAGPHARKGRIFRNYQQIYPITRRIQNAVSIRFYAGYGTTAASVPEPLKAAMKLLIGHWYRSREAVVTGTIVSVVPQTVNELLWPFKSF